MTNTSISNTQYETINTRAWLLGIAALTLLACVDIADIHEPALSDGGAGGNSQVACSTATDCPPTGSICVKTACSNGSCDTYKEAVGTPCGQNLSCDAAGICNVDTQMCVGFENGVCNEPPPAGDGTCPQGTDTKDCTPACATTENGVCDEPEGTGQCSEGSDAIDCTPKPCSKCFTYAIDPSKDMLCNASQMLFMELYQCACDNAKCLASCGDVGDICDSGQLSNNCNTCMSALCQTQYSACTKDG